MPATAPVSKPATSQQNNQRQIAARNAESAISRIVRYGFALLPWLTLGFITPVAFLTAAMALTRRGPRTALHLWLSTLGYGAALIAEFATVDAGPGSTGATIYGTCLVITMPVAGFHALAISIWLGTTAGHRRDGNAPPSWSFQLSGRVAALAFRHDPGERQLLTAAHGNRVTVHQVTDLVPLVPLADTSRGTGRPVRSSPPTLAALPGPGGWGGAAVLSHDGSRCAWSSALHHQVTICDFRNGSRQILRNRIPGRAKRITALAFSPVNNFLAVATRSGYISVFDLATGTQVQLFRHGMRNCFRAVRTMAYSGDGRLLASGGTDGRVDIWDSRNGTKIQVLKHPDPDIATSLYSYMPPSVSVVAFNPSGYGLGAASHTTVVAWPDATSAGRHNFRSRGASSGQSPTTIAFSPDGVWLAIGQSRGTVSLWHTPSWQLLWNDPAPTWPGRRVRAVAFNSDGTLLASGSAAGTLRVWQLPRYEH